MPHANNLTHNSSGGSGADSTSSLDNAARAYRNGTAIYDASCTWSGQLPQRIMRGAVLSCKVVKRSKVLAFYPQANK